MRTKGATFREIFHNLSISLSTVVSNHKANSSRADGNDLPRKGAPRKTSPNQDALILHSALNNREQTYKDIRDAIALSVSITTVRRCLLQKHLKKWQKKERTYLDDEVASQRLVWALEHRN